MNPVINRMRTPYGNVTRLGPVFLLALALGACSEGSGKQSAGVEPRAVRVETVRLAPLAETLVLTGTVRARYEIPLGFRVPGKIAVRLVDAGARVKAGDALARLVDDDYQLALNATAADVRAAEAEVERADAQEARTRELNTRGHASQANLDQVQTTARAAHERLSAARSQREIAANRLTYTVLRAEADGAVTNVSGEPGQVVAEGTPVLTLATDELREAVVAIPESRRAALGDGAAEATFWAIPDRVVSAKLRVLSPEADAMTRTFLARFTLQDAGDLPLGITAQVRLTPIGGARVAQVAATAVWWRGEQAMVWVVDGNRLTPREVKIVRLGAERVAVAGDLADGEQVVVLGVHRLDEATAIRVSELR